MATRLYVGGLPYSTTEEELRGLFESAGSINSVAIITDRYSGQSRGFGFVEMESKDQAQAAIRLLNGTALGGRALTVNEARERDSNSSGPRRDSNQRSGYGGGKRAAGDAQRGPPGGGGRWLCLWAVC